MKTKKFKSGMKGQANVLAIFFIALFVVMLIMAFTINTFGLIQTRADIVHERRVIEHNLYEMKSAVKASELYLETAHTYSLYQALYDVFRHGGHKPGSVPPEGIISVGDYDYALWYDNGEDLSLQWEDVMENFETMTKINLRHYTRDDYTFMDSFTVEMSGIEGFDIELIEAENPETIENTETNPAASFDVKEGMLKLSSVSTGKLHLHGDSKTYGRIDLAEGFSFEKTYNIIPKPLFEKASQHFEQARAMFEETTDYANEEISSWTEAPDDETKNSLVKNIAERLYFEAEEDNYKVQYALASAAVTYDETEKSVDMVMKVNVTDLSINIPVSRGGAILNDHLLLRYYLRYGDITEIEADPDDEVPVMIPLTTELGSLLAVMGYVKDNSIEGKNCYCGDSCENYAGWIIQYSDEFGIPDPLLALSLMMQESSCVNSGDNGYGYCGLMQISCRISNVQIAETNIKEGLRILKGKYDTYKDGKLFNGCSDRGIWYTEWKAAVRGYNGWRCNPALPQQDYFVDEVFERYDQLRAYVNSIA